MTEAGSARRHRQGDGVVVVVSVRVGGCLSTVLSVFPGPASSRPVTGAGFQP